MSRSKVGSRAIKRIITKILWNSDILFEPKGSSTAHCYVRQNSDFHRFPRPFSLECNALLGGPVKQSLTENTENNKMKSPSPRPNDNRKPMATTAVLRHYPVDTIVCIFRPSGQPCPSPRCQSVGPVVSARKSLSRGRFTAAGVSKNMGKRSDRSRRRLIIFLFPRVNLSITGHRRCTGGRANVDGVHSSMCRLPDERRGRQLGREHVRLCRQLCQDRNSPLSPPEKPRSRTRPRLSGNVYGPPLSAKRITMTATSFRFASEWNYRFPKRHSWNRITRENDIETVRPLAFGLDDVVLRGVRFFANRLSHVEFHSFRSS